MAAVPCRVVLLPFSFFESRVINPMVIRNAVENFESMLLTDRLHGSYMGYDGLNTFNRIWFLYIFCDDLINVTFHVLCPLVWAVQKSKNNNIPIIIIS